MRSLYLRLDNGPLEAGEFRGRTVACPACGHVSDLPETHRVMRGGRVSLIWVCPSESCPYSDFLHLEEMIE